MRLEEYRPPHGATQRRRWGVLALRASLTVAALSVLMTWLDPQELFGAMRRTGIVLWGITVIVHIVIHLVVVGKWRVLLRAAGCETDWVDAVRAHGAGVFANLYLPSIVGGDVVRASLVTSSRQSIPSVVTGGIADRITDCVSLTVLAAGGMLWVSPREADLDVRILTLAAAGLVAIGLSVILIMRLASRAVLPRRLAAVVTAFRQPLGTMWEKKAATGLALALSVVIQSSFVFQNILIADAIGIRVSPGVWFIAWPLAKLASLAPVSLGGLGIREGALAALLLPFGVPATLSVASSLVWQTVMYSLGLFGGITSFGIGYLRSKRRGVLVEGSALGRPE